MHSSLPPVVRSGSQERNDKARLEAEALFRPAQPRSEAANPIVTLKKRRSVPTGEQIDAPELQSENLRAPRVHRIVSKETFAAVGASTEVNEAMDGQRTEASSNVTPPRRRRRRLHGRVTIVGPTGVEVAAEAGLASDQVLVPELAVSGADAVDLQHFERVPSRRYTELMARVEKLQAEADKLRKSEAAKAIEWMREAIQKYGLSRQDLGFR